MMYKKTPKKGRGFTLIEILIVISIISILSVIAFASFSDARKKSRDSKRIIEVENALVAMKLYGQRYGTYEVAELSEGDFAPWGDVLVSENLLSSVIRDPMYTGEEGSTQNNYHLYFADGDPLSGVCIFADLEKPRAQDQEAFDNAQTISGIENLDESGMNYGSCIN